jgi:hypothetical protein
MELGALEQLVNPRSGAIRKNLQKQFFYKADDFAVAKG